MSAFTKPDPNAVAKVVDRVCPILAGHHPGIQGAALADLLAIWLAGHPPEVREGLLTFHIAQVRQLIAVNAAALGTGP
jgi:hypothetical protein